MYTKILAAVNEHLNSEISARYALNLAKACKAKLYICFIAEKGMHRLSLNRAEEAMKRLFNEAMNMNMQVESITGTGEPLKEIDKVVRHEKERAIEVFGHAIEEGFGNRQWIEEDPDFDTIRDDPRFGAALRRLADRSGEMRAATRPAR